ncbi:hypothetical protein YDYSY3_38960 [Paenibacillus chitinolyticus]|uniref:glycoside hydrolase domain-containing protein n=1 Tax=Paenibacillus chitinolyticus TaxID=79263 RepID=UPI0026E4F3D0|nr:glycoside hydrolase domain-containing protein [Paenibacillus chitinolyticus]GKS12896.1 hypothetical protein YDYSY3_38960 [Paenibacillus chitinolyticus]
MDQMVLAVQEWANETYESNSNYNRIEENGRTGWPTITALTTALQIELGITTPTGSFGPATTSLCPTLSTTSSSPQLTNIIKVLQGALFCKGYNPTGFTGTYGNGTKTAITKFQTDAGLKNADGITTPMIFKALLNMDAFVNVGDTKVRSIQQYLNRDYSQVIGLIACDGRYSRSTNKALIYALQIEEGIPEPNGSFGPTTTSLLPTLSTGSMQTKFIYILQFSLYVNGFDPNEFDGSFGQECREAVRQFQEFCMLTVDGIVGKQTWASLLVSTGDKTRKGAAFDCVTTITPAIAQTLVSNGYTHAGRYIIGDWKKLKPGELDTIFAAGMKVYPIYQSSGSSVNYFHPAQGAKDAKGALIAANSYGFPFGTLIYFAVDYDALDGEVTTNIIPYFSALYSKMLALGGRYRIGIYGPRNVCSRVAEAGYSFSSFVSDMSTGFSGNLGYPLPKDWAFDQIATITIGSGNGKIEIDNNIYSGRNPGVSFVVAPAELNTLDDELFLNQYRTNVEDQLVGVADYHMSTLQKAKALRSRAAAVAKVFEYDALITQLSQTYSMRKAMIQAVLFRELCFEGAEDVVMDSLVASYYSYKHSYEDWENLPLVIKAITPPPTFPIGAQEDCSTGHAQIFAKTAINSNNYAVQERIISGQTFNVNDWKDMGYVWNKLHTDQVYNISVCPLVLLLAAEQVQVNRVFYQYDIPKVKKVIARYNGTGDQAIQYGEETYQYYTIFEYYNKMIRE